MTLQLNQIYNMDCLIGMQQISDKSIDMILCDLPYGVTRNQWDSVIPIDKLWAQYERIIKDNQDALKILERYNRPDVFAYIDPPYLLETRTSRYYETELQNEDHVKMLDILKNYKGKFILSGYDHPMYDDALPNCYKVYYQANAEARQSRTEVLWMNYEPTGQLSLL